ncbi:HET-domain-containing protein [Nemania sp. FL0916]|nr:HET-domain-containing protein [Nemania sp. FL0916]
MALNDRDEQHYKGCESCRGIDFKNTLRRHPSTLNGSPTRVSSPPPDCPTCRVLFDSSKRSYRLAPRNFLEAYRGFRRLTYEEASRRYLGYCSTCLDVDGKIFFPESRAALLRPRRLSSLFDPSLIISRLEKCKSFHPETCMPSPVGFPDRLIDCRTRTIVKGRAGMQYVALSYVWGLGVSGVMEVDILRPAITLSDRLPDELPQTIADAIAVTAMIGYRYIWIDMYCIDQTDLNDKHRQISHMDIVYAAADVTIIVAAGEDCHSGIPRVGKAPDKAQESVNLDGVTLYSFGPSVGTEVRESKWWARAWTFQEGLLSHRRIVFTNSQVFFECNTTTTAEAICGLELVRTRSQLKLYESIFDSGIFQSLMNGDKHFKGFFDGDTKELIYSPPDANSTINRFQTLARIYTEKSLSFESDALNAFNAISMSFATGNLESAVADSGARSIVLNLSGVPFSPEPEHLQLSLTNGLLWSHVHAERREFLPTWTWAGYKGIVDWEVFVETPYWVINSIKVEDTTAFDVSELADLPRRSTLLHVREILVTAPIVKRDMWKGIAFSDGKWKGRPNDPWGKFIFASPVSHGFKNASAYLLPALQSGRWEALCAGSSRRTATLALYIVQTNVDGSSMRVGLAEMRYGWKDSSGEQANRENDGLRTFLDKGTVERLVRLV